PSPALIARVHTSTALGCRGPRDRSVVMYGRPPWGKSNSAAWRRGLERSCIRPVAAAGCGPLAMMGHREEQRAQSARRDVAIQPSGTERPLWIATALSASR
ncbi:MAG: hypothetical protein ACREFP_05340, partial [Acetobacteraceae bacterium]